MLKLTLALAGSLLGFAVAITPASANLITSNTIYDWTLGGPIDGSGKLTTGNAVAGGFDILSFTGDIGGNPIGGLLGGQPHGQSTSPLGAFYYDNLIFSNDPSLDIGGVLFQVAAGLEGNIWGDGAGSYSYYTGSGAGSYPTAVDRNETFAVSAVPEPITLCIFGVGLLGAGVLGRRKKSAA